MTVILSMLGRKLRYDQIALLEYLNIYLIPIKQCQFRTKEVFNILFSPLNVSNK